MASMTKPETEVNTELIPASRGPVAMVQGQAGTLALAQMSDAEFGQRLAALKKGQERIRTIKRDLMEQDSHYGVIPGTGNKPTLLKPGAEVLCSIYGLRPDFIPTTDYGDGITSPAVRILMRCELHLGDLNGPVVAVGVGASNSWERKYRYRRGERTCPSCGTVGSIRRSSYPNKAGQFQGEKGWWCRECRTNWDDPRESSIIEQQTGDVENPDQHDLENTLLKMAKKRAHIDAALTGTASSDLFTQDLDENDHTLAAQSVVAKPQVQPHTVEAPPDRDPGSDDLDWPNRGDEAYESHGVQRAAQDPPMPARPTPPTKGPKPPCPHCGKPAMASKFPKPGQSHYCYDCKHPFEPGNE